ncbi:MAG: threonine synthase [Spirochaetes bacterium]|uniref:Threonine synthase n=1 Tax=Candidatus Ornithospirochaeta stercoripullorum TaxID=2840899 RepID=A0A9D9H5Z8_9SPIO|nr:threonine synthase [Candidatus Ornithospirochaeta stercoripullorum]
MRYISTRAANEESITASEAILKGLAPDGGLFIPQSFPRIPETFTLTKGAWYAMYQALLPYFDGDELSDDLEEICRNAFSFPVPFHTEHGKDTLELYFGPTAAFKDFGARFLAFSMEKLLEKRNEDLTILVATSGDTGGAVASAFHGRNHLSVKVLFPKGRVAERQRMQLTGWDGNVTSYEVDGTFDDCQRMVKEAFMDTSLSNLSSANSINLGRLLPQMAYYVYASSMYEAKYGEEAVFVIPSGNIGNATGAYWAKAMGAPIKRIVLACNANKPLTDYLESGSYEPRASIKTLANAMDVGAPSNIERLFSLFPDWQSFKANVEAYSISDDEIRRTIREVYEDSGYVICPHTACAERVRRDRVEDEHSVVVSTAHPAKFNDIVEKEIGREIAIPANLYEIMHSESRAKSIAPDYRNLF